MADFIAEIPKAELHLHLEGSIEPETLHELDPATPVEEYRALYSYADFDAFLRAVGAVGKRLRSPEDYALVTRRLLERLARQNVRYAEIILAAGGGALEGAEFGPIFDAVRDAAAGSRWKCDGYWTRSASSERSIPCGGRLAAERGAPGRGRVRIGGRRARPAEWFTDAFVFARQAGLRLTAHAGESDGPGIGLGPR
jgi:adenosine deaminase/aminodeoxyfutalosine deaminase